MTAAISNRVLVLGVDDRAALTVVRSLGRKGLEVHVGVDTPNSLCTLSRYTRKVITLPNAGDEPQAWKEKLLSRLETVDYDLIIPTADNYLVLVVKYREEFAKFARLAVPDDRGFQYTYRKSKTFELAKKVGVPIPETYRIESLSDLSETLPRLSFPVIIKPISSKVWKDGRRYNLNVSAAQNRPGLEEQLQGILPLCPALLQSFHLGYGVGQEFLTRNGELIAAFQHERVHEPLGGGGSSYRKSVPLDPVLLKHSMSMLKELAWTGVAMVEYKYDPLSGEYMLMEINGRFWGSLPLAIAAGVDFPGLLYDMMVLGKEPAQPLYKYEVYCRNFVKDFDWFKENLRADKSNPLLITVPLPKALAEVKNILLLREHYDTLVWDDPRPGLVHIGGYLLGQFQGAWQKLKAALIRLNFGRNTLRNRWRMRKFRKLVRKNPTINFVCKGNICRSPFAEYYLKRLLVQQGVNGFQVVSTGFIERINRPSPENALRAAKEFGVDLSSHRSKLLTEESVNSAGVLIIMDVELFERIKKEFPAASKKVFFLGEFYPGTPKPIDIHDPYGKPVDYFKKTYKILSKALESMREKFS